MRKKINYIKYKDVLIVSFIFIVVLSVISVGYAGYNRELKVNAVAKVKGYGKVVNKNITVGNSVNFSELSSTAKSEITELGCNVIYDFISHIKKSNSGELEYEVELYNDSDDDFTYNGVIYGAAAPLNVPRVTGIEKGDVLAPGETRKVKIIFYFLYAKNSDYDYTHQVMFVFLNGNQDISPGGINTNATFTDVSDNIKKVDYVLTNLNDDSIKYSLKTSKSNFIITDTNEVETSYTSILKPGESVTKTFFIKMLDSKSDRTGNIVVEYEDGITDSREDFEFVDSFEEVETNIMDGITVELTPVSNPSWKYHYNLEVVITNDNDFPITDWTLEYILLGNKPVCHYENYAQIKDTYLPEENKFIMSSVNKYWEQGRVTIPANGTYKLKQEIVIASIEPLEKGDFVATTFVNKIIDFEKGSYYGSADNCK